MKKIILILIIILLPINADILRNTEEKFVKESVMPYYCIVHIINPFNYSI